MYFWYTGWAKISNITDNTRQIILNSLQRGDDARIDTNQAAGITERRI